MDDALLAKLAANDAASDEEMDAAVVSIKDGSASEDQIAAFRSSLFGGAAPIESLAAFTKAMREHCEPIVPAEGDEINDVCGTGGAMVYNSFVAAAIVAAAGGARIVKPVRRRVRGISGNADLLKALGVNTNITPEQAAELVNEVGIAFIDAENCCGVFDKLFPGDDVTPELACFLETVDPFVNAAKPTRCLIATSSPERLETITKIAQGIGIMNGFFVCGVDGVDEMSLIGTTHVNELASGRLTSYDMAPEENALEKCTVADITAGTAKEAAYAIRSVFAGKLKGPRREAIVYNGSAALMASGKAGYMMRGLLAARNAIDYGQATDKLEELKKKSNSFK